MCSGFFTWLLLDGVRRVLNCNIRDMTMGKVGPCYLTGPFFLWCPLIL